MVKEEVDQAVNKELRELVEKNLIFFQKLLARSQQAEDNDTSTDRDTVSNYSSMSSVKRLSAPKVEALLCCFIPFYKLQ